MKQLGLGRAVVRQIADWFGWMLKAVQPGQGLVEYSLLLMLMVLIIIGILTLTGHTVSEVWYDKIIAAFPS